LSAWLIPEGRILRIADDREGHYRWPTSTERERAAKEQERAAKLEAESERDREKALRVDLERTLAEYERRGASH
jgi:hypothetical protein